MNPTTTRRLLNAMRPAGLAVLLAVGAGLALGQTALVSLSSKLSAASEVPPGQSAATGSMEGSFDRATGVLRWKVTHGGLSGPVTAAHLHGPAMPGENAGVVVPFAGPLGSPIQGEARLDTQQASDLLDGKWYVNLHTSMYPGGEIRGQVLVEK
jgi:hypothetical protein